MKNDVITEYARLIRNIAIAAHSIINYAYNRDNDKTSDAITWADVGSLNKVYSDLLEIARFCNITVKEV